MHTPSKIGFSATAVAAAALLVTACGGGDWTASVPQLGAAQAAAFAGDCADLSAKIASLPNTTVTAVNKIAAGTLKLAGQDIAEHCQVLGSMYTRTSLVDGQPYAIKFEMRLPKNWNGRFFHQGNGGTDGIVQTAQGNFGGGAVTNALLQGFAVLSSDAGHPVSNGYFGIDPQARLDYGYQAVGKLTPMAKDVIKAAYGKNPDRSYFGGCSNGGRHAMIAATRYADDYDGILAGAPGYNLPKAALANLAGARLYASVATVSPIASAADLGTAFTDTERTLVRERILAKCDALDGVTDGLVQDVAACQASFNLAADVPTCTGSRDGTCLSSAQKSVIAKIFSGTTTSDGKLIYASFPYDAGINSGSSSNPTGGVASWEFFASISSQRDAGALAYIFKSPPESTSLMDVSSAVNASSISYALNADLDALNAAIYATSGLYTEASMSFMTPPKPNEMFKLRDRGGKIMVYHGTSDAIFSVNDSEAWFNGVAQTNGAYAPLFTRFFRVPSMGHCSGGPSTDQFDMLTPLVNWVEKGQAPEAITASARGAGNAGGVNIDVPGTWAANRTRPLCAYPKVARYKGSGSVEDAASFSCQ